MSRALVQVDDRVVFEKPKDTLWPLGRILRGRPLDAWALGLALCAAPISIAVCETFLVLALLSLVIRCLRGEARIRLPRVFYAWSIWAALEIISWIMSPDWRMGCGEVRHLFLILAVFFVMPALGPGPGRLAAWRGIFLSSLLSAVFLIGDFGTRFISFRSVIGTSDDMSFYLRSGGLLNHWMVYGTVEILIIAGLMSFWSLYPEERRRWWPVVVIHALAILLSLTRMVWIVGYLILSINLVWRRSRWALALPVIPIALYLAAPGPVRMRINESMRPDFYSNAERLQMAQVGWKMIKDRPLTGVGPGRVEVLYLSYLNPGDPVPAYHGHLHNNLIQLAAEFGIPVALAAIATLALAFWDLAQAMKAALSREEQFICRTALLGLIGFAASGLFDYTYGHSLGLILLGFVLLSPLIPRDASARSNARVQCRHANLRISLGRHKSTSTRRIADHRGETRFDDFQNVKKC